MATGSLGDILGQESALAALRAAMTSRRVHHAWIFHGPPGVGKFTAAVAFGAALLDPTSAPGLSGEIEPDPDSETQRLVRAGIHPDLHIVTKELARHHDDKKIRERKLITIPKEVVDRWLLEPAARSARVPGGAVAGKVFILDEAELLNLETQNALLKTLEEPAPGTVIILVTSAPEELLPTIRSRCQRVAFEPLGAKAMATWMKRWMKHAGASLGQREAEWIIEYSSGSPGRALVAAEGGLHEWAQALDPLLGAAERGEFSADLGGVMAKLVDDWAKAWVDARENASKDAANKAGASHLFNLLAERARRSLRRDAAGLPETERRVERSLRAIELIGDAERELDCNVNMGLVMENLAAQMARN